MSAFNTVRARCLCPACGNSGLFEVQFKYGNTWQFNYELGDSLQWGGNDVGISVAKRVRVEAIAGPCPHCGIDYLDCDLFVSDNTLERVELLGEERKFETMDGFEIID